MAKSRAGRGLITAESLEEYALIAQEVKHVEIYRRADDWRVSIYTDGLIELHSVELTLALDDLYAGVIYRTFAPSVRPEPVEGHSSVKSGVRQAHPERLLNPKRKS